MKDYRQVMWDKETEFSQPIILQRLLTGLAQRAGVRDLVANANDDISIALLDVWAMVLDVVGFYQSQYNKESYLATATDMKSVRELVRTIGYELSPGIAASTFVNFILEDNAGKLVIPASTQLQNIPRAGSVPQTFETDQALVARAEWNVLKPHRYTRKKPLLITAAQQSLCLAGTAIPLQVGDKVLLLGTACAAGNKSTKLAFLLSVTTVQLERETGYTKISWQESLQDPASSVLPEARALATDETLLDIQLFAFQRQLGAFGCTAPAGEWDIYDDPPTVWDQHVTVRPQLGDIDLYFDQLMPNLLNGSWLVAFAGNKQRIYLIKNCYQTALAGYTIKDQEGGGISARVSAVSLNPAFTDKLDKPDDFYVRNTTFLLGATPLSLYQEIELDPSFSVISQAIVLNTRLKEPMASGKQIIISTIPDKIVESVRVLSSSLTAKQQKVTLELAAPLTNQYESSTVTLETSIAGLNVIPVDLEEGDAVRQLSFTCDDARTVSEQFHSGMILTLSGYLRRQSEVVTIGSCSFRDGNTLLTLKQRLQRPYYVDKTILYANVVAATHGKTVVEILGGGDASQANQVFNLTQRPLTYLPAANARGMSNTLSIRVNDVLWQEVTSFNEAGPTEQCYVVRLDENNKVSVLFGDGIRGARLPSGQENVHAVYRVGLGLEGEIPENSLAILQSVVRGVKAVNNPVSASGAAGADDAGQAQLKALSNVNTLERIVSLRDFEYFVKGFAGIAKVQAKKLLQSQGPILHLTIASESGSEITENSLLYQSLKKAIGSIRQPGREFRLDNYQAVQFNVSAELKIASEYQAAKVLKAAEQSLLARFGFTQRELAQGIAASDLIGVLQQIPGVIAVHLNALAYTDKPLATQSYLAAKSADVSTDGQNQVEYLPAQLLTINPNKIDLSETTQ
ncbi:MAG: hypothetical protein K0S11_534 [Gammaproteobacteria bacterium]|jgi:hypothetical protein|nr:hypothetical protein [Gammaproteobacteria bacterium]